MSSLVPKIRLGRDTQRNSFDISCMTHTTSEIGYVQPTFGRTIVPKSKVRIGTRTGSRLSPLFVPTMGKIDIRHYHCFVPYTTIWTPFDSFITKQNYTLVNGTTYVPEKCPYFTVKATLQQLCGTYVHFTEGYQPHTDLTAVISADGKEPLSDAAIRAISADNFDALIRGTMLGIVPKYLISKEGHVWRVDYLSTTNKYFYVPLYDTGSSTPDPIWDGVEALKTKAFPSCLNFDFSDFVPAGTAATNSFRVFYNFNGGMKRLRTIFMGLGYSFNPYDVEKVTPFKLLAFYKAYFALFGVNREKNFFNTYCYKIIKLLSESTELNCNAIGGSSILYSLWLNFIREELASCTYTCPVDYFSVADTTTQRGAGEGDGLTISTPYTSTNGGSVDINATVTPTNTVVNTKSNSALGIQLALRLLRFVNKNSVIGRKVSDILRARYGVSDMHNLAHESVVRVGASSTDIEISAIYSNTDSESLPLGAYAGAGMSSRQNAVSKSFTFETSEFGVLITLTAVVPKMGYFQGMLRENSDGVNDYTEFWQPEFDGLGWQGVRYNELVADKMVRSSGTPSSLYGTDLGIWGYVPRMTHLKCGFNRCLGDISIPHMQDSMLPYTLDRFFKNREPNSYGIVVPTALPVNESQSFRAGTQGDTNRIFTDMSPTEDHVIMQIFFDVKMSSPMKSISTCFDTWDEESKQSVEVAHE